MSPGVPSHPEYRDTDQVKVYCRYAVEFGLELCFLLHFVKVQLVGRLLGFIPLLMNKGIPQGALDLGANRVSVSATGAF